MSYANYVNGFGIFNVADAHLNTDGWYKIALSERKKIAIANFYSGLAWTAQNYGVSASFAGDLDTNGFISWGFGAATVSFAGSNSSNCSNDTPNWYFSLSGTNGVAYDLNCAPSATKLQTARTIWGQSFDGSEDVNGYMTFNNGDLIWAKDTSGTSHYVLGFTSSLGLGYGSAGAGYDTYILGANIHFRYSTSRITGMTLNSSGNVLIGTTTDNGYKLFVNGAACAGAIYADAWFRSYGQTGWYNETYSGGIWMSDSEYVRVYNGKSFWCDANIIALGEVISGRRATSSDARLKDNITTLTAEYCLNIARQLRPTEWDWKTDGKHSFGFIAQDVNNVLPCAVTAIKDAELDERLNLQSDQSIAIAIGGVQGVDSEVQQLKRRVKKLEDRLKEYGYN